MKQVDVTFHIGNRTGTDYLEIFDLHDVAHIPSIGSTVTHQTKEGVEEGIVYDSWPVWKVEGIEYTYWDTPASGDVTIFVRVIPMEEQAREEVMYLKKQFDMRMVQVQS